MTHIPNDNFLNKTRREKLDVAIVGEAIRILKNRHSYKPAAFQRWLTELGLFVAVPDEVTPEWVHRIALDVANDFVQSRAPKSKSDIAVNQSARPRSATGAVSLNASEERST
jgi:hypothetical protein